MASNINNMLKLFTLGYFLSLAWTKRIQLSDSDVGISSEILSPTNDKNQISYAEQAKYIRKKRDIFEEPKRFKPKNKGRRNVQNNPSNEMNIKRGFPGLGRNAPLYGQNRRNNSINQPAQKIDDEVMNMYNNVQKQSHDPTPNNDMEEVIPVKDMSLRKRFNDIFRKERNYTLRDLYKKQENTNLFTEFLLQGMSNDFDPVAERMLFDTGKSTFGIKYVRDKENEYLRAIGVKDNVTRVENPIDESDSEVPVFDESKFNEPNGLKK